MKEILVLDVFPPFCTLMTFDPDTSLTVAFKLINCCGEVVFKVCTVTMRVSMDSRGLNGSGF